MDIHQIRYFLEAAESQHITRSAEKLHVAQPALTRSIHRLEQELGVPLFIPNGRGIVLSEYGKYLQKKMAPLLREWDAVPDELQKMAQIEEHIIRVNVLAASTMITDAVIAYKKTHPELSFQLLQNTETNLYDISVHSYLSYTVPAQKAEREFILAEKIFLAVPIGHQAALQPTIRLAEAAEEPFINLMGSRPFRHICDHLCHQAGFIPNIVFESDNPSSVKNMIAAEMGVGFWPEYTWGKLDNDRVHLLEIVEPKSERNILIGCRQDLVHHPIVGPFFAFLKHYCLSQKELAKL